LAWINPPGFYPSGFIYFHNHVKIITFKNLLGST